MKKEIVILGLVILVLLVYLFLKNTDNVHYAIPELPAIKAENIDKVEIKKADLTITLAKQDGKWVIAPNRYPTDEGKVTAIVDFIGNLTLTDLVSKSKNYSRYELDPGKAILVKAYLKDKAVREFEVGKAAATYSHTYVKIKGDDNVYHARESFRSNFDVKLDDFRDKNVLKFDVNEISELTVEKEGQTLQFSKKVDQPSTPAAPATPAAKPEGEFSWQTADGKKGNKSTLDAMIASCTALVGDSYIAGKTSADYTAQTPVYTVKFKGRKDYVLTFYARIEAGEDNGKYPVISSENPYPFLLNSYKGDEIMKKSEDLLEKPVPTAITPEPAKKEKKK